MGIVDAVLPEAPAPPMKTPKRLLKRSGLRGQTLEELGERPLDDLLKQRYERFMKF